jgi:RNA polymerase sigma factor (sigma-70 family)
MIGFLLFGVRTAVKPRLERRRIKEFAVSSDPKLLLDLLEEHGADLLALFTRITLRADVAEDLLQELFLKLRNAGGLARANNCKAYLFRAAMHLAFDWRRARQATDPMPTEVVVREESPLDHLIGVEQFKEVLNALQTLSELNREVLVLRYLQNHEYAKIAEMLGKTEHHVRAICSKALGHLRTALQTESALREPNKRGTGP